MCRRPFELGDLGAECEKLAQLLTKIILGRGRQDRDMHRIPPPDQSADLTAACRVFGQVQYLQPLSVPTTTYVNRNREKVVTALIFEAAATVGHAKISKCQHDRQAMHH